MMDSNEYSMKISLRKKNIKELRVIARSIGVSSPTSKQKEDLIADIVDIMEGRILPDYKNVNRGRPTKSVKFVSENSVEYPIFQHGFGFSQKVASPSTQYGISMEDNVSCGVICFEDNKYIVRRLRFVKSVSDFEVTEEFIKNYKLHDGDLIEYTKNNHQLMLLKINNAVIDDNEDQNCCKNDIKIANNYVFVQKDGEIYDLLKKTSIQNRVIFFSNKTFEENNSNIIYINQFSGGKNYFSQFMSQLMLANNLVQMQGASCFIFDEVEKAFDEILQRDNNYVKMALNEIKTQSKNLVSKNNKIIYLLHEKKDGYNDLMNNLQ